MRWHNFTWKGVDLQISKEQMHNGKTYSEILEIIKDGESIATYDVLQKLRNEGHKFLKNFWVFVLS